MHRAVRLALAAGLAGLAACVTVPAGRAGTTAPPAPVCGPFGSPAVLTGTVQPQDARTYRMLPFAVPERTRRVEVAYSWADAGAAPSTALTQTVFDLGLWDADGYRSASGFRGWSGSRQGRIDQRQRPVFVQANAAERGYLPGEVEPGVWHVELGVAAVGPNGASWRVEVACGAAKQEPLRRTAPFATDHVARDAPGWYHGDFHMHAYHSHPNGPDWDAFVTQARAAKLDFLPVTEYVTPAHWDELRAVQRDPRYADVLFWPGREVITYFGHVNVLGETPGALEYRHGFEDVRLSAIQKAAKQAGALFQVNHPTIFPGPAFQSFCRGCEFTLGEEVDWDQVDTIEVVTGPAVADPSDAGGPKTPVGGENPFLDSAIELWEKLLAQGHKIAPVSGSDSKGVDSPAERPRKGYGSSATAVYAERLSRDSLVRGIQAGHVYVRARGVLGSPTLEMQAVSEDGRQRGTFGDVLRTDRGTLTVTVSGGDGQFLRLIRNGTVVATVPVVGASFTQTFPIARVPLDEGPLGTFYRVETLDRQSRTTIGNAVFLQAPS